MTAFASVALPHVAPPDPSKHVDYQLGMVLGVDDFQQEFTYLAGRDKRIVRDLLGYGVVSGLRVTTEVATDERGPRVHVAPGAAVAPSGQLICVSPAQCAYLNEWLRANRSDVEALVSSPPSELRLFVVACYRECETDDVPIPGEPCRTEAELMKPSRVKDDFAVELRLKPPAQLEEDAVRAFVGWVRRIPIVDEPAGDVKAFLDVVRSEAHLDEASSPPGTLDFLHGSPPASVQIPREAALEYLSALFAFWTAELRPRLRSLVPGGECGCGGGPGELDPDADCLLLAELSVPIAVDSVGGNRLVVADMPPIAVDEISRASLVHLRLVQEWLLASSAEDEGAPGVVAGRVLADGTVEAATGGLEASRPNAAAAPNVYLLSYPGHLSDVLGVVTGQTIGAYGAKPGAFELIPETDPDLLAALGSAPGPGIVVRAADANGDPPANGFMVHIDRAEAAS